jgi:hypothetical protein
VNGVSAEEFRSSPVAITAWKATVAKACSSENSDLIRVTIISIEDVARRLLEMVTTQPREAPDALETAQQPDRSGKYLLGTLKINFEVSYTLQDLKQTSVDKTTATLKANYEQSVATQVFTTKFAEEIKLRSNSTSTTEAALVQRIQPAEVVLAPTYTVIQTTDHPTFRPSASPTTGTLSQTSILLFCASPPDPMLNLWQQLRQHCTGKRRRCPRSRLISLPGTSPST